jgi:hypothetical protein
MWDLLGHPTVRAVLVIGFVLVVAYFGFQVIFALRPNTSTADTSPTDLLSDFEEMQSGGDINEEELRNIKSVLGRDRQQSSTNPPT